MDLLRSGVSAFASLTGFGLASPSQQTQSQYSQSKSSQTGSIFNGGRAPLGPGPSMSSQLPPAGQTPGSDEDSEDEDSDSDSASDSDSESDEGGKGGSGALKGRYVSAGRKKKVKTKSGEIGW